MYNHSLQEIRIELLQKCTLACVHCSAESSPSASRALNSDLVLRLVREGTEIGLKRVVFTGGEPLIDSNLSTYISEATHRNLYTTIFTAGYLKANAGALRIAYLASVGLNQVNVSMYSTDAQINAQITRKPDSLGLSQNVLYAAVANNLVTEIHFVPMAPNMHELEKVAAWAEENGVRRLSVLKYVPQGRGRVAMDSLAPAPTDEHRLRPRLEKLMTIHPNLDIHVGPSFGFLGLSDMSSCESGFSSLSIRSDGLVYACDAFKGIDDSFFLPDGKQRLSLADHSLVQIWKSCPYLCSTRKFIEENTKEGTIRCAGGCVSQCIYRTTT